MPSFCILPPKPSHDIYGRDREVAKICLQLKELKKSRDNGLSYLFLSGNPGTGKSQLAGLVGQKIFDEDQGMPGTSSFVMTLNCLNLDSLLESYASFARHLRCPENSVVEALSDKGLEINDKIANLKMLVAAKMNCYTSWLLVFDNVVDLVSVYDHLPEPGHEAWARGQLLITTSDTKSVPLTTSFINHISVSQGMEPDDACCFLAKLSGIPNSELAEKVANMLDFQPLGLASAAYYVKTIKDTQPGFGWGDYLKILERSKEEILADAHAVYPNTLGSAIKFVVKEQIRSDNFFKHLFSLLSRCAPEPLNEDAAINHIMNMGEYVDEVDKKQICMRCRKCPLFTYERLFEENFIRVHPIVLNAIKNEIGAYPERQTPLVPNEIKARGRKAMLAYENALKTERVKVYRARIMLIGQDRAGKTSLKNSFLGLPFDPNQQSTDGIELDLSKFEVDVNQVKNWKHTNENLGVSQFAHDLARMVAGKLEQDETNLDPAREIKVSQVSA